jgi:hypothetical protein
MPGSHDEPQDFRCRRAEKRFPLALPLKWRQVYRRSVVAEGAGRTLNLSTGGMNCILDRQLPPGSAVEVSIRWPALLHGSVSLSLSVEGTVLRTDDTGTAIRIHRHEFKTAGSAG